MDNDSERMNQLTFYADLLGNRRFFEMAIPFNFSWIFPKLGKNLFTNKDSTIYLNVLHSSFEEHSSFENLD